MEELKTISALILCYKKLPGIGEKTAERLAYGTLSLTPEDREEFIQALSDSSLKVRPCPDCGLFCEDGNCPICKDPARNHKEMMIVSNPKDIYTIEKTKGYDGIYFTLSGTLSPLRNRTPERIGISKLREKVEKEGIEELILALPTDLDGETTSLYLANLFKGTKTKVTRLAYGIPIGTNLEYLDNMTISQSIRGRVDMESSEKKEK